MCSNRKRFVESLLMSRVAMENRFPPQGRSRIPQHVFASHPSKTVDMENRPPQKASRLLQMKADYQDRLMKEKEEKLVQMYENNQRRALQKVNQSNSANRGTVREFFQQRRMMATNPNHTYVPPIQQHFNQMKNSNRGLGGNNSHPHSAGSYHQSYQKHSAGIDRSNPLAPINRKPGRDPQTPPVHQKPQIVKSRNSRQSSQPSKSRNNSTTSGYIGSGSDETPPPNLSQLKLVHNQRARKQSTDLTDYQKWQVEQDRGREERLANFRQKGMSEGSRPSSKSDEDEGNAELQRQQKELMAQIAAQQAELEEIRLARLKEEAEEKKEMERRRRHEEERRKRMKREEEKQRLMEEEESRRREEEEERLRIKEERMRQKEEELQQRLRMEEQKAQSNNNYNFQNEYSDQVEYYKRPSPPPQSKPPSRRPVAVKRTQPQPSPPPKGSSTADTSLYDTAGRMEGAYEDTSIRLVPCSNCGRKFSDERIEKHELACPNLFKKRKVLDPSKLRTAGTDMEKYARKKQKAPPPKKSNWRAKHESFIESIRYAKAVTKLETGGGSASDLPPPPKSDTSDLVPCPHCSRKFNVTAAERHIPRCQSLKTRPVAVRRR
ncbi:hypothetical protein ScPMuIL_013526 [Solemya velum]